MSTVSREPPKDERGLTALHRAAGVGALSEVRELLAGGADPTVLDSRAGASPLHHAAQSGRVEVARLLLAAGAFVNLQAPRNGVFDRCESNTAEVSLDGPNIRVASVNATTFGRCRHEHRAERSSST